MIGLSAALVGVGVWVSRNFRDGTDTIPPRGGESLVVAAIPTVNYLQRDSRWADETVGGSQESLARVGCTVCSLAMALDRCGVKITPKELNSYLKRNDGYTARGWLKWDSVSKVSEGKVSLDYIGEPSFERIDSALKNGQPVIAKVFINRVVPHWVLIVGKEEAEYLIRDPLGDGESLRPLSHYGSEVYAIRILKAAR
jgi:Peptidase_C39 like family